MRDPRKLRHGDICERGECINEAQFLVYSRHLKEVSKCCEPCRNIVDDEDDPEYVDTCGNCGCVNPIN